MAEPVPRPASQPDPGPPPGAPSEPPSNPGEEFRIAPVRPEPAFPLSGPHVPDFYKGNHSLNGVYPDGEVEEITDFQYFSDLHLMRFKDARDAKLDKADANYVLARGYEVRFKVHAHGSRLDWKLVVPRGMYTDLVSVPRLARAAIGRVGPHLEAAIVHDWLYIAWQDLDALKETPRKRDHRFADLVFREGMRAAKVKKITRWAAYQAVRRFGWKIFKGRDESRYVRVPDPAAAQRISHPAPAAPGPDVLAAAEVPQASDRPCYSLTEARSSSGRLSGDTLG